jgi:HK97 family phage prohead protease
MLLRHLPGAHPQKTHGGAEALNVDKLTELYGDIYDEAQAGDLSVIVFERGDFGIFREHDDDTVEPFLDGLEADTARDLAEALGRASTVDIPDGAETDSGNGLVDWIDVTDDVVVGWDPSGDVSIVLSDYDRVDLSPEDAQGLVDALERMADRFEELDDDSERSALATRHLPGAHDQDKHGGGIAKGLPARVWSKLHKVAGGELDISADPDRPGLAIVRQGGRIVALDRGHLQRFRSEYFKARLGQTGRVVDYHENTNTDGKVTSVSQYAVIELRPAAAAADDGFVDGFDLVFGHPSDTADEFDSLEGIRVTDADIDPDSHTNVIGALTAATAAKRIQTSYGPLDVFPAGNRLGLRMKDDNGDATEVHFTADEYARIAAAADYLLDGFDDDSGTDDITELTVKTAAGPVLMRWRGPRLSDGGYDPDGRIVIEPGYPAGWSVVLSGEHIPTVLDDMDYAGGAAGFDPAGPVPLKKLARTTNYGEVRGAMTHATDWAENLVERLFSERVFDSEAHPRAPKGTDTGGQFAKADSGQASKAQQKKPMRRPVKSTGRPATKQAAKPSGNLAYDPKTGRGPGYGMPNGHPEIHKVQDALIRLGLTDSGGDKLKKDGKLGPKTTAAIKKAQQRLGLRPDGVVTPALLAKLAATKTLPAKRSSPLDLCVRSFDFELRSADDDGRTLEGYAAVFNSPTRIKDFQGEFDETILPGAFRRSLQTRTPVLQWDHGKDPRIGTAPIGAIEDLREDDHGLFVRARLFDDPDLNRIRQAIAAKAVSGMSFRFGVPDKGDTWTSRTGQPQLRAIRDADVHELGPVVFPAYAGTSVGVRSLLAQLDADDHAALIHELAAEVRLAVDLQDLTGRPGARSAGGGDTDAESELSAPTSYRQRLDEGALRVRGILR